jgi:IclR family pca regulon transcriptional regulator
VTISLAVGSRLPAYATSMGRVLLSELPEDDLETYLDATELEALTDRTVTDRERLRAVLDETRRRGWALVDQELELGLRSIAAPIRDAEGRVVASLNTGTAAARVPLDELRKRLLPQLLETADAISANVRRAPGAQG